MSRKLVIKRNRGPQGVDEKTLEDLLDSKKDELREQVKKEYESRLSLLSQEVDRLTAALTTANDRNDSFQRTVDLLQRRFDKVVAERDKLQEQLKRWQSVLPFEHSDIAIELVEDLCTEADKGNINLFNILRDYGIRVKTRKRKKR